MLAVGYDAVTQWSGEKLHAQRHVLDETCLAIHQTFYRGVTLLVKLVHVLQEEIDLTFRVLV